MLHVHLYKIKYDTGVHSYGECRCGKRKVYIGGGAHQPIDYGWLNGLDWDRPIGPPPPPPLFRSPKREKL